MPTPSYLGARQPAADGSGSLLDRIGSLFGGVGTPSYSGVGQPTTNGGYLAASAPAAGPAPMDDSSSGGTCDDCPIDSDALAAGQIAIVIPRSCNDQ